MTAGQLRIDFDGLAKIVDRLPVQPQFRIDHAAVVIALTEAASILHICGMLGHKSVQNRKSCLPQVQCFVVLARPEMKIAEIHS